MPAVIPVRVHADDLVCWWLWEHGSTSVTACGKKLTYDAGVKQLDFMKKDDAITCIICASVPLRDP